MNWPGARDWVFSVKTFAAAMLALYIGFAASLPRPYWAMATVYIVSQPLSGATRSKAVYRALGTLLGAAAALVMVPNLVDAPVLLSLAMAAWAGGCLYVSLLDRTPRAYVALLAAYSAPIIGFPAVTDPGTIFDTAIARVEEILLGITCAAVVASVVFPRPVGPAVGARVTAWLADAERWALDMLGTAPAGRGAEEQAVQRVRRLAADAVELDMMSSHLAYDTEFHRSMVRWIGDVRWRLLMLLPVLSSVSDRLRLLRAGRQTLPDALQRLLADLADWLRAGADAPPDAAPRLRRAIGEMQDRADAPGSSAGSSPGSSIGVSVWQRAVLAGLLLRLRELVDLQQDLRDLRRYVRSGGASGPLHLALPIGMRAPRALDRGLAALSGGAAALAVLAVCGVWIATAWPDGAVAAEMAAVVCCFFATHDNPVPATYSFLRWSAVAVLVDALYLFAVLPAVQGFEMLVLVLAPSFLLFGLLIANPATTSIGMALGANGATLLGLQGSYSADFPGFVNSGLALVIGMAAGASVTATVRAVGADWRARRLLRANWRDLADAAAGRGAADRARFAGLMMDRLGVLAPRLAAAAPGALHAVDALAELRVGLNALDLRRVRRALPGPVRGTVDAVLGGLAAHFGTRVRQGAPIAPPDALRRQVDEALGAVAALPQGRATRIGLLGLVGVRRGLFPDAPGYDPDAAPDARHPVVEAA